MIFDSRDIYFKNPFGAVRAGDEVILRLMLPLSHYSPMLAAEKGGESFRVNFDFVRVQDGINTWQCVFTPKDTGVYYYHFEVKTDICITGVYKEKNSSSGVIASEGELWQLTVYSENEFDRYSEEKFAGGVMYQIFPDRFSFSGKEKSGVPGDRIKREWNESLPFYGKDNSERPINRDYWCGDLAGITDKIGYLSSLGVTCIYLNPIFEAHSNHRYNTADYERIDPLLGNEKDLKTLCETAEKAGISVILDGVFSHTGDDSRYFNRPGRYGENVGAARDEKSPYIAWYDFEHWPDKYACWWGVPSLPQVDELNRDYLEYITGENGIARRWMRLGVSGWRLDVADELPDGFLYAFNKAVKSERRDAAVIGEVWEDASNKQSYGQLRRYLLGGQLDSVMNYPWRSAVLDFLLGGNAEDLAESIMTLAENYPTHALNMLMNILSTHDTERLLTALCGENVRNLKREEQAVLNDPGFYDEHTLEKARRFLRIAAGLQFTLPGIPCIYYGDETGLALGGCDPFNRAPMRFSAFDKETLKIYRTLGMLRRNNPVFKMGDIKILKAHFGFFVFERRFEENRVLVAANRWCDGEEFLLPDGFDGCRCVLGDPAENGKITVKAESVTVLITGE